MSYIYDTKTVNKPRSNGWCRGCQADLPVGKPRTVVTYYNDEFNNATLCLDSKECLDKFAEEYGLDNE